MRNILNNLFIFCITYIYFPLDTCSTFSSHHIFILIFFIVFIIIYFSSHQISDCKRRFTNFLYGTSQRALNRLHINFACAQHMNVAVFRRYAVQ